MVISISLVSPHNYAARAWIAAPVTAAVVLTAGALAAGVVLTSPADRAAAAVSSSSVYVDNSSGAHCSDTASDSGTEAQPFCTIAAAAAVVQPGRTVFVEPGTYAPVTISVSGAPGQPITFEGATSGVATIKAGAGANAFLITGAHDVVISGFNADATNAPPYEVTGSSSGITINGGTSVATTTNEAAGVEVDAASDVTVSRGSFATIGPGIDVNSGASGVVVTGNTIVADGDNAGVLVAGSPGSDVVGNTVIAMCGPGIALSGGSTGASIENNIVSPGLKASDGSTCETAGDTTAIAVSADSTSGSVADYNLINLADGAPPYAWGGASYSTQAAFNSATGQGAHDIAEDLSISGTVTQTTTPGDGESFWLPPTDVPAAIDSANADAPGELATDELGNPRADDPSVPNTGAGSGTGSSTSYFDRGAVEDVEGVGFGGSPSVQPSGSLTLTAAPQKLTTTWATNGPIGMYEYNFGDSPFPVFTTATSVQHTYQTAGLHTVQFFARWGGRGDESIASTASTVVGAGYTPVTPTRILDTRKGTGTGKAAAVPAGGTLTLSLPGVGGTPAAAMTAVVMNVTVTGTQKAGFLTVFPGAGTAPDASNLNFAAGQTVANLVTVQVSDGEVSFHNASRGTVQVVADLAGYYGAAGNGYQPQTPLRVLDTRHGTGAPEAAVPSGGRVRLNLSNDVPAGTAAVVLNVTVTQPSKGGWVAVTPDSSTAPGTSSLNFSSGQTLANQVIVPLTNGVADFYNGSPGTLQVVADLDGYYDPTARNFFVPIGPVRVDDTRTDGNGPIKPLATYGLSDFYATGCDPAACPEMTAAVLNMTVTEPTRAGNLIVYPTGASRPLASSLNFVAGQTVPNLVTTEVTGRSVDIYNSSAGSIQLVTDAYGYFIASS
jgi:hypothetical protein